MLKDNFNDSAFLYGRRPGAQLYPRRGAAGYLSRHSASAMRKLEARLEVRLLTRTTRSVALPRPASNSLGA
ncbi:hypothetical protein ACVXG7_26470 [Enterobacter hormaechei]